MRALHANKGFSILEMSILIMLVAILMLTALPIYLNRNLALLHREFESLGLAFTQQINFYHKKWLAAGQPALFVANNANDQILVSSKGWPEMVLPAKAKLGNNFTINSFSLKNDDLSFVISGIMSDKKCDSILRKILFEAKTGINFQTSHILNAKVNLNNPCQCDFKLDNQDNTLKYDIYSGQVTIIS